MQNIDEFEVRGELGRGAMGVVYRAYDPGRGAEVAIKLMTAAGAAVPDSVARFERECQASLRLDHPNVVKVIRAGSIGSVPYLALELVEGQDLDKRLSSGPLPQREAAHLCVQIAAGLEHAHSRKVLHRDLKPANVLLHPVRGALLTDFGLAKVFGTLAGRSLTQSSDLLGSPAYMSPEQATAAHDRVGARSDVYGLGAILYECLTGSPPCWGTSLVEVLHQIVEVVPDRPSSKVPGIDRRLDAICLKCLAKDPKDRYSSAAEVGAALEAYLAGPGSGQAKFVMLGLFAAGLLGGLALLVSAALAQDALPSPRAPSAGPSPSGQPSAQPSPQPSPSATPAPRSTPSASQRPVPTLTPSPKRFNPFAKPLRAASPDPSRPSQAAGVPPSPLPADDVELTDLSRSSWELEQLRTKVEAVLEVAPDSARAHVDLARVCLGTGEIPRGRAAIKRALELDPDYGPAYRIRGMLLMRGRRKGPGGPLPLGDIIQTTAERSFTRALELDPHDWQAHRERAVIRTNLKNYASAEQDFAAWIAARPSAKAFNSRGFFEATRGRVPAAKADFTRSLELDPKNAVALRNLTELARAEGKLEVASGYLSRLLDQSPKDAALLRIQVDLLAQRRLHAQTIAVALRLEAVEPQGTLGPLRRAFAHQHLGQYRKSRAPLQRLLQINPRHPKGLLLLLRARAEDREWAGVVETCDLILSLETLPGEPTLSQVKNTRRLALAELAKQKR